MRETHTTQTKGKQWDAFFLLDCLDLKVSKQTQKSEASAQTDLGLGATQKTHTTKAVSGMLNCCLLDCLLVLRSRSVDRDAEVGV